MVGVFALTGGIGTGKTRVLEVLRSNEHNRSVTVIDADEVAHELQRPGTEPHARIRARWPSVMTTDGTNAIDRDKLSAIVFAQTDEGREALRELNGIMQGAISMHILRKVWEMHWRLPTDHIVIVEAPVILEMRQRLGSFVTLPFSGVVVVTCAEAVQKQRLMARGHGMPADEAQRRIDAQLPLRAKERAADFLIDNSGTLLALHKATNDAVRFMQSQSTFFNGFSRCLLLLSFSGVALLAFVCYLIWIFVL